MSISSKIRVLKHNEGLERLLKFAIDGRLIPIFGSGMTMGASSHNKKVPDGKAATDIMKDIILNEDPELTPDDLSSWDFNKTSEHFYDLVDTQKRDDFFKDYFTNVRVNDYRANFFRLKWPHAYTLNVDDGIENSAKFYPVIPYREIKKEANRLNLLYKLHGDALSEITYKVNSIVFSSNQYIKAIKDRKNKSIYDSLVGDYTQNNILYCGCSLENEPDIEFFVSTIKKNLTSGNMRAILKGSEPTTSEKLDLLKYGINEIIVVDDYRLFFDSFCSELNKKSAHIESRKYKFVNPKIEELGARDFALSFLTKNITFNEDCNKFLISKIYALRSCLNSIENELRSNNSVVIKGRRFSGKSMILMMLCHSYKAFTVYYFPSNTTVDSEVIRDMLKTSNDSIFLFDSNSLSNSSYATIAHASTSLKVRNNRAVIAVNSNDNYMTNNLESGFIEIDHIFDSNELYEFNEKADDLGIIRRNHVFTNIDYAKSVAVEYDLKIDGNGFNITEFNFHEKILILMLAALDKVYYSDIAILDISFDDVKQLIDAFDGIILESVPTTSDEREKNSINKLVHNSKLVLLNILDTFTDDEIISCLYHIVYTFKGDRKRDRLYIDVMMYDTLNQLFPKNSSHGAGKLIPKVYDSLHPLLKDDPHYWLQRSKSLYRIFPDDAAKINESLDWVKKAYNDGDIELKPKAALSSAIILCLQHKLSKNSKEQETIVKKAIKFAYEAINSPYFNNNKAQFENELSSKHRRKTGLQLVLSICEEYSSSTADKNSSLYRQSEFVCSNLRNIQTNN